jgi:pyruvate ferredoxin oxidoreductase delta subunit
MGKTGTWRVFRPEIDTEKCIVCWRCWIFCPDAAIHRNDKPSVDYEYCKGCGICANECPVNAIEMRREEK